MSIDLWQFSRICPWVVDHIQLPASGLRTSIVDGSAGVPALGEDPSTPAFPAG